MKLFLSYVREIVCLMWYVGASVLGMMVSPSDPTKRDNKKTILIVSGIGSQPLAFIYLKSFLQKRGFTVYFFRMHLLQTLGFEEATIDKMAQEIGRYIEDRQLEDVVILGMSAGAVACLLFLEQYSGWKKVKHFISLSGAFKGGWLSYLFLLSSESYKFRPGGVLDKSITQLRLKHPEKITSFYGKWDEFVVPKTSQLPGVINVEIPEGGHAYLQTFSKKTFEAIAHTAKR